VEPGEVPSFLSLDSDLLIDFVCLCGIEDTLKIPDVSIVESSAELLYGLVHQRFILTRPGLQAMVRLPLLLSSPSSAS
jgi:hypothetical protein